MTLGAHNIRHLPGREVLEAENIRRTSGPDSANSKGVCLILNFYCKKYVRTDATSRRLNVGQSIAFPSIGTTVNTCRIIPNKIICKS